MKNNLKIYARCAAFSAILVVISCTKSSQPEPEPEPEPVEEYPGKTVLLYMAACNSLSQYVSPNIDSLLAGHIPDYFDETRTRGNALLVYVNIFNRLPSIVRLYKTDNGIVKDTIDVLPSESACDPKVMADVMKTVFNRYPAQENGLILWSHGTGWLAPASEQTETLSSGVVSLFTFGEDTRNNDEMELYELASAIPFKMDYIIFDCCLMGGVETAYELKDKAEYIVSSSAEIMADGFPYARIMCSLLNASTKEDWKDADLRSVAEAYFKQYESKKGTARSATISLIQTSTMTALAKSVRDILDNGGRDAMMSLPLDNDGKSIDENTVQRLFRRNISPYRHYYYDIEDLMRNICGNAELYNAFDEALSSTVLYKAATPWFFEGNETGFEIRTFCGLTMNIPSPAGKTAFEQKMDAYYKTLGWNAAARVIPTE